MPSIQTTVGIMQPGLCDAPVRVNHGISLHLGRPASTVCLDLPAPKRFQRVAGGLNIVPAGATSRWVIERLVEAMFIRIPTQLLSTVAEDMDLDSGAVQLQPYRQAHDERIALVAKALHLERKEGMPGGVLLAESLEVALCTRLVTSYASRPSIGRRTSGRFTEAGMRRLAAYIDENLDDPRLSLSHLASVAGTSVSYLKAAFRRSTGRPLHRYVVERRVERAAALLAVGGEISDVAAAVGFSHASHLARWTQRLLQVPPQELRRAGRTKGR
jgi:AraC family transcriptional regulator